MSERHDIDEVLRDWPYEPGAVSVRRARAHDGREVLQMRIEMGVLQMEVAGRPDGAKPHGCENCLEWLVRLESRSTRSFRLTEEQCVEMDREFLQYYHRRVCWLALREFRRVVDDADHTLQLMDFASLHSPSEEWVLGHERYRTFVLFHRAQAAALAQLEESRPEAAMDELNAGLRSIRTVFAGIGADDQFEHDEQVRQLLKLKRWLRREYHLGRSLQEQLDEAVASEQYELAARLRDQIAARREESPRPEPLE
jgi:hypothetical protein